MADQESILLFNAHAAESLHCIPGGVIEFGFVNLQMTSDLS
jgi:hypothetical protein